MSLQHFQHRRLVSTRLDFCALTSGYLTVRGAGEGGRVKGRRLAGVGGGLVVMGVVRRRHPHGAPSQMLQLR